MARDRHHGREGVPGGLDLGMLVEMRLDHSRAALAEGDVARALVEAEELLDQDGGNLAALEIVGEAALLLGDPSMASLAWQGLVARKPDDARARVHLGLALLHEARVEEAQAAVQAALDQDEGLPLAWHLRALTRRLLRQDGAEADHAQAHRLAPADYPLPRAPTPTSWTEARARARDLLPEVLQSFFAPTEIRFAEQPSLEELGLRHPPPSPLSPALAVGDPPEDDPWGNPPQAVLLFQGNLAWPPVSGTELAQRIREALVGVAEDWIGEALD